MDERELKRIEEEVKSWIYSRRIVGEALIAEVRRLRQENERLSGSGVEQCISPPLETTEVTAKLKHVGKFFPSTFTEDDI